MGKPFQALRVWAVLLALTLALAGPAWADDNAAIGTADATAIHRVVQDQLTAFQKDDGDAAFGYASPMIHQLFGSAANFMSMVKTGYQPVYRPRSVEFGAIDIQEGAPTQHVFLVGPDGVGVEALYFMEHEPDGTWRINGCVLKPNYQA